MDTQSIDGTDYALARRFLDPRKESEIPEKAVAGVPITAARNHGRSRWPSDGRFLSQVVLDPRELALRSVATAKAASHFCCTLGAFGPCCNTAKRQGHCATRRIICGVHILNAHTCGRSAECARSQRTQKLRTDMNCSPHAFQAKTRAHRVTNNIIQQLG